MMNTPVIYRSESHNKFSTSTWTEQCNDDKYILWNTTQLLKWWHRHTFIDIRKDFHNGLLGRKGCLKPACILFSFRKTSICKYIDSKHEEAVCVCCDKMSLVVQYSIKLMILLPQPPKCLVTTSQVHNSAQQRTTISTFIIVYSSILGSRYSTQ